MTDQPALFGKNLYLYEEIIQAFETIPQVREYNPPVTVQVNDGVVTLGGVVVNLAMRREMIKIAARISGVKQVINGLLTDREIEQAVAMALATDEMLKTMPPIIVNSYNGRVTLSGRANTQEQIDHAQSVAASMDGVHNVVSELML